MIKRWYFIKLRKERGLSVQEMADEIGMVKSVIWQMENLPSHNPTIKTLGKIAAYFGVQVSDLVLDTEEMLKHLA